MKVVHHDLDNPDWREAVSHSPYFTHEQRDFLLQKSDLLLSFYQLFEEWTDTLRSVPEEIVNVDKYVQNAFRILWVLPSDLPGQKASLHTMMKEHPTWEDSLVDSILTAKCSSFRLSSSNSIIIDTIGRVCYPIPIFAVMHRL